MRTKVLLSIAAALMLIVSMVAIGSNMGFKISIPLTAGYSNFVAVPYFNSYTTDNTMYSDITGCTGVNRWNNATGAYQSYTGGRASFFNITEGEAYIVTVSSSTNWVVVGSHDPSLAMTLTAGYSNFVSVPYHTTATTDNTLYSQITGCTGINRWNNATGAYQSYTGGRASLFNVTAGEGYIVTVSSTTAWTPAHY